MIPYKEIKYDEITPDEMMYLVMDISTLAYWYGYDKGYSDGERKKKKKNKKGVKNNGKTKKKIKK